MTGIIGYPSIPNLVIAWALSLGDLLPGPIDASTALPISYEDHLPFLRVTRVGGSKALGIDRARVRFEVFGSDYDAAEALANALDSAVEWDLPNFTDGSGRVTDAEVTTGSAWSPWDDETVIRFMGAYAITVGSLL